MINRLLGIIYILLKKGTVTAGELAERFEVSTRTIYRDMENLSMAGIPVYTSKGKNGGISLTEQFVLDKLMVSDEEQQFGTNEDGSRNEKYCCYCFQNGHFVGNSTMEEMVKFCAKFEVEGGRAKTLEEAEKMLLEYFPTLERWKNSK